MAAPNSQALKLYKTLLRESQKFHSYNFRLYALRRIRDEFRENKSLTDSAKISEAIKKASDNLEIVKRQVVVGNLYTAEKLVIEKKAERDLSSHLEKS
ncbi:hypothetical protein L9F63_008908 [Diploptera punctata]|uniref:Complex 1 LYR protein domain-containing protein n=1 Tax=Diploptera punctata TaxID=6984 RepID=A0AAD7Z397_DIPPU|nr:hypothetical protein L9F63_008908 [Diploptera punctata]